MDSTSGTACAPASGHTGWVALFRDGRAVDTLLLNLGISLHALDIFIMTTVMPTVIADIGGLSFYTWTAMLYMVGSIVGAAGGAYLRVRFGQRRGYIWGGVVLVVGTIGCAVAPDMASLLVARVVKGLGGGFVISQSMALVRALYAPAIRTHMLALITGTWSIAALIGPLLGGVFGELDWWRGAFWATVPFGLAFVWMAGWRVPAEAAMAPASRLPWRRLAMLTGGVLSVGMTSQFHDSLVNGGLTLFAALLVWLTFVRDHASDHRLFPSSALSLFSPVGLAYWVYFLVSVTHTGLLLFAPLFLQVLHGVAALYLGSLALVFSIGWTAGSMLVAGWSERAKRIAAPGGMALAAFSIALFALAIVDGGMVAVTATITIAGLGIGATNVLMTAFGMYVARPGEESVTASSMTTVRSLGVAFGAAISGLVANVAGLDAGIAPETVSRVALWVLSFTALVPVAAMILSMRAHAVAAREAANSA